MKLRKNGAHPAVKSDMRFWILCVCFLLGMAAAYPARRSISTDALAQLGAYVQSYAQLADGRSQQPVSVLSAAAAYLRYPLLAFLFGLSAAGVALIPLLCAAQGFFLSFSVCCFAAALGRDGVLLALAALGLVLWLVYLFTPMAGRAKAKETVTDWSFLRSSRFWLLTGLLFCQNAAEQSVVGWMVTYFKDSGIIAGTLAAYTVTVMWGATLIGRLLIAFVFPLKQPRKAMVFMAVFCTAFYFAMMQTHSQLPAILLLFAFAFSMAGMNPTAVASAGKMTTVTSMGIMLPVASSGAILMPWVIGKVAESAGLAVGMATNIVPCVGLIVFAILVSRMREE